MNRRKTLFGITLIILTAMLASHFALAQPVGPSGITMVSNETKGTTAGVEVNISGGTISTLNITAVSQNLKWKAFVGYVTGKFTLDDASSSTIYDWTLTTVSGQIYTTRNSTTPTWSSIACADLTDIENENVALSHTNPQDNLTSTFTSSTHPEFFVGGVQIAQDSCGFALNTYVNNVSQGSEFYEVALSAEDNIVYATIIEEDETGFDGNDYDFQMIVPEVGSPGFSGSTAYYLYVELT